MFIERVSVEPEGFLANLDLKLVPGLNVIIGARGTGKTSLLEVIRYGLRANALTGDALIRGSQQALAVLDGAQVTIVVAGDADSSRYTRSGATEEVARQGSPFTVLAQNEIESVAIQAAGRLALIDRFRPRRTDRERELTKIRLRLRSLTETIASLIRDGVAATEQLEQFEPLVAELATARAEQESLLAASKASESDQNELARYQEARQIIATRQGATSQSKSNAEYILEAVTAIRVRSATVAEAWPSGAGGDPLLSVREKIVSASAGLFHVQEIMSAVVDELDLVETQTRQLQSQVEERSRALRQKLEVVQAGIGDATKRVSTLEQEFGRFRALESMAQTLRERFVEAANERDEVYTQLESVRDEIYRERHDVISQLNAKLGPSLRLTSTASTEVTSYLSAVIAALRGSGLKYASLSSLISARISPIELVTWVERGQASKISNILGISEERAQLIVRALRESGTAEILAAAVEDGVSFELLDGPDYKPTEHLSIGQRCTAVLPILLAMERSPLLIDQPEDHLDNAFIASTLVKALRERAPENQIVFTSHNANIPVLGNADQVIVMESDGQHAWVAATGTLKNPDIIDAITRIMEGGREAFHRRGEFYGEFDD